MDKKLIIFSILIFSLILILMVFLYIKNQPAGVISPLSNLMQKPSPTPKPLEKYSLENLKQRGGKGSGIVLERLLEDKNKFMSYIFSYTSEAKKITGLINIPKLSGNLPVIIMLRGYVDKEIYESGVGTKRASEVFSQNGFITLAPDFLGYGESDMPPNNVWEERFLRPLNILDLLESIPSMNLKLNSPSTKFIPNGIEGLRTNSDSIGIWGHSNGGMLALAVLEISGRKYPTSLWAPVSKFFPYDVLYYTYEYDDKGKAMRKSLADLEKDYDTEKYSIDNYFDWINSSLIIHQGMVDDLIPIAWTNSLVTKLKELKKEVNYYTYPGADHNMKGSWDIVVQRDMEFFRKNLDFYSVGF